MIDKFKLLAELEALANKYGLEVVMPGLWPCYDADGNLTPDLMVKFSPKTS